MSVEQEPAPELTTARVRGGPSAWLVALVVLGVLGSVVYIGVSGNNGTPVRTSNPASSQPVAVDTVPSPSPSLDAPGPDQTTTDAPPVALPPPQYAGAEAILGSPAAQSGATLGTGLVIGDQVTMSVLADQGAGQLHAAYRVPLPAPTDTATIQLVEVAGQSPGYGQETPAPYGTWSVRIGVFHGGVDQDAVISAFRPTVLVAQDRPPDRAPDPLESRISRNGFNIQVTGQRVGDDEIVNVDVVLRGDPVYPDENYEVAASAGSQSFVGVTQDSLPGHFRGEILLPPRLDARTVTVKLSAVPNASDMTLVVVSHKFPGPQTAAYSGETGAVTITAPPAQNGHDAPGIVVVGYTLTILMTYDGPNPAVFYDVRINPSSDTANHHWVTGNDGLVGWPSGAGSASQQ